MNSNNIKLSIYLQNYIIKILCKHINKNNKIIDIESDIKDYRENESEIKKLVLSISLVNKSWFKTIQNNINVSVDLNFKNTTFSIFKIENIKTLKLHYNHEKNHFYILKKKEDNGGKEVEELSINEINNSIMKLESSNNSCFKRLIFRNINITNNNNLEILNQLYKCNVTENKIELLKLEIGNTTSTGYLNSLCERVRKLHSIIFNFKNVHPLEPLKAELLFEMIEIWYKKELKQFSIYSKSFHLPIFQLLSNEINQYFDIHEGDFKKIDTYGINYLKNIEYIELYSSEISLNDLLCIFSEKSLPNLSKLIFEICFDKLNYYLSTPQERKDNQITNCHCTSLFSLEDIDETDEIFNEKWKLLLLELKTSKIKFLEIKHYCKSKGARLKFENNKLINNKSFLNGLTEFVTSIKSLSTFCIVGPIPIQLNNQIILNNNNNKSIINFEFRVNMVIENNNNNDYYQILENEINRLINSFNHIKSFKLIKMDYNNSIYSDSIFIDYKKLN